MTAPMTDAEIREALARAERATCSCHIEITRVHGFPQGHRSDCARTDVPRLVATIREREAEVARLTAERDEARAISAATAERVRNETQIATELRNERDALRAELDALKAKPRFRTRKVTKADVEDFIAHDGRFYESLRALGFRRRVDGAK